MSRNQRLALLGLAVVVVVVGFIVLQPGSDDDDSSSATQTVTVVQQTTVETTDGATKTVTTEVRKPAAPKIPVVNVKNGEPVGGVKKLEFDKGDTIDFKVKATAPGGEVHFHGYDVHETVPADGGTVEFKLKAKFDGRFVVEMEDSGQEIAQVEVQP
jgi:hypothetical protein